MKRTIIEIDEDACTGCRLCVDACHEGAIGLVDGKARLLRDDYCDGLGDCLPACPTGAITFVEREAEAYDADAVAAHLAARKAEAASAGGFQEVSATVAATPDGEVVEPSLASPAQSCLNQWPVQIKLMPVQAPYYQGNGLLVAADCTAFACADFHQRLMGQNVTIIGCPKLDEGSYLEKLTAILSSNDITALTIARMEVPCCGGLERAALGALEASGRDIPARVITFSVTGDIIAEETIVRE